MKVSEVFGYSIDDHSSLAWIDRGSKRCSFRSAPCNKSSNTDPIGICSVSDGLEAASLCPNRFLQGGKIFQDAASLAFGSGTEFAVFPEIRILQVPDKKKPGILKKIGKVDFVLGRVEGGSVTDFCAVELQASYFSGYEIRTAQKHFLANRTFGELDIFRRPDFRSSAQKRLIPQLKLKVPVFRRWGKKFFVIVDTHFFNALPSFPETKPANSEVTWLVYPIAKAGTSYEMGSACPRFTEWDHVESALNEGHAPDPIDILKELQLKLTKAKSPTSTAT